MRISTITNWAYWVTLLLTGLAGAAFLVSAQAADRERAAVEQNLAFDVVAEDLSLGAEALTDQARLYAMRGAARHLDAYRQEATVVRGRDRALLRIRRMDAAPAELAAIAEAERNLGDLDRIESWAVNAAARGDREAAQQTLFGPEHERAEARRGRGAGSLPRPQRRAHHRRDAPGPARQRRRRPGGQGHAGADRLLFLGVLYFVLRRRVSVPLTRMTGIVNRLAGRTTPWRFRPTAAATRSAT